MDVPGRCTSRHLYLSLRVGGEVFFSALYLRRSDVIKVIKSEAEMQQY
jgi:hypothetical protein